ncbi:hypothetical protein C8J57DRAFT_1345086 [Mycena rebaudengoi]|nr:hypothetical protein C8J57DRAFT_1345086 [Mycena rebaudengoi]
MELPQEIVDEIVDYVAISPNAVARSRGLHRKPAVVDKNSLKACALTSPSFLPRSQKRLLLQSYAKQSRMYSTSTSCFFVLRTSAHTSNGSSSAALSTLYSNSASHGYCICCPTWTTSWRRALTGTATTHPSSQRPFRRHHPPVCGFSACATLLLPIRRNSSPRHRLERADVGGHHVR